MPDETGSIRDTRFQPGQSGNPLGRPRGSRSKLAEAFWIDLHDAWVAQGKSAIDRMIEEKPGEFVKVVASQMPKEFSLMPGQMEELSDDDVMESLATIRAMMGARLKAKATNGGSDRLQ